MTDPHGARAIRRHGEQSREDILEAATELFARNGYAATTLQQVGARAGVSRGTPGYFFGSKDELYRAVLARVFEQAGEALRASVEQPTEAKVDDEEAFRRSIGAYVDFLSGHPELIRLVEWEALGHGGALKDLTPHAEMVLAALGTLGDMLGPQLPAGFDTTQLMLSIVGLCWFPLAHRETLGHVLGIDAAHPLFLEARKRHVADLVLWGIRGERR